MTAEPVAPPDVWLPPDHPLYLPPEHVALMTEDEFELYCRVLQAEAEGWGTPVAGSPGAIADLVTGGLEQHPPHLKLIDQAYMDLGSGEIDRLLITMPPQHGKSTRTRWGSLHRLQHHKDHRLVVASAELDLAREHTKWVRDTIVRHGLRLAGLAIQPGDARQRHWTLAGHRGGMYAVGMGGALTGRPADGLVLDDPVRAAKDVERPEQRQAMWDWWTQVAMTRLAPKASVVVVMTRWHEDDIAGRILKSDDAARWKVLHLPALCEDPSTDLLGRAKGAALWPERYDEQWLHNQQRALGSRAFAALYQGAPVPAGGTLLQRHWFRIESDWPKAGQLLRCWDLAATDGADGADPDWTVGALMALHEGRWFILNIERFRESPHGVKQRLRATAQRDGRHTPIRSEQEPGSSGKQVVHDFATTVFPGYDYRARTSTGSKVLRANPFAAAAEAGNVTIVDTDLARTGQISEWVTDFLDEAESFPFGAHDDQIDAVAAAMAWLIAPVETERVVQQQRWGHVQGRR